MEFKAEKIQTHLLKPYAKNPRKNKRAIQAVAESITNNGFYNPIVIDQDNRICAGHTRWEAAKLLNIYAVPCHRATMTEAQFIRLNIEDNKTSELSTWDNEALTGVMKELDGLLESESLALAGFSDKDIDKAFGHKFTETSQAAPEPSDEADFGDVGKVKVETIPAPGQKPERRDEESKVKKLIFAFSTKQYKQVDSKLKAIMKENELDTTADALLLAMKSFKGLTKTIKKKKAVTIK